MSSRQYSIYCVASIVSVSAFACGRHSGNALNANADLAMLQRNSSFRPLEGASKLNSASLILTTPDAPFVKSSIKQKPPTSKADLKVDTSKALHSILGFGGAFNEQGWEALTWLSAADRDKVLASLFDPANGLRFGICRAPIGASDYALNRYTLDEAPEDYKMEHFSIERDRKRLIPYIKAAQRFRSDLRIWASAWTPPTWMKTNGAFDGGAMKDDPKTYAAYALYQAKYVESYRAEGIDVFMVVPQNEPSQLTHYPSCEWKPQQYVTYIRDYLGPLFRDRHVKASIYAGTFNTPEWDVMSVLKDTGTLAQLSGVALQWGGLAMAAPIRLAFPNLAIMQSETECGNNHWEASYDRDRPPNDFKYAAYTWRKFRDFIAAGSSSYMLWNMILDDQGKNIDAISQWPQNSPIVVHRLDRTVTLTPMYWATKHFSGLVDPGAKFLRTSGEYADAIAFVNPDGTTIVELLNTMSAPVKVLVSVDAGSYAVDLPRTSFASLVIPKA